MFRKRKFCTFEFVMALDEVVFKVFTVEPRNFFTFFVAVITMSV